ncbi:Leukocyte receptor cluster member 8-like [Holothuria leucospilota]|uniref:Leukocyte receptor cluster member 8-like n=1 Tax=Holothuria leucospilota TaxID=206669 RepID=A0A9Q1BTD4_HOLLE|nr:Leukocyte receptor cluster member 8-like [Holothuria leucospilota]
MKNTHCVSYQYTNMSSDDITTALSKLSPVVKNNPMVQHALALRTAVALSDYHKFFLLYRSAPKMSPYLMDMFVERQRKDAVKAMIKAMPRNESHEPNDSLNEVNNGFTNSCIPEFGAPSLPNEEGNTEEDLDCDKEEKDISYLVAVFIARLKASSISSALVENILRDLEELTSCILHTVKKEKAETFQYIPLAKSLKKFLEIPGVMQVVLGSKQSEDNILSSYYDGDYYKEKFTNERENPVIPLLLYNDDFETANPLGSKRGKHKEVTDVTHYDKHLNEKVIPQPFILCRGCRINPSQTYVIIERNVLSYQTLHVAIDACFKCFYVLHIEYQPACYSVWKFFESVVYEMPSGNIPNCVREIRAYLSSRAAIENDHGKTA